MIITYFFNVCFLYYTSENNLNKKSLHCDFDVLSNEDTRFTARYAIFCYQFLLSVIMNKITWFSRLKLYLDCYLNDLLFDSNFS